MSADTEWAEEKAKVVALGLRVQAQLGLGWWTITHQWDEKATGDDLTLASTLALWEYGTAAITWNLPRVAAVYESTLEATMIHEMVHVMMAVIEQHLPGEDADDYTYVVQHREFAVESVTRAIASALKR